MPRKEAEWCFLRPKTYKGTAMGEKTSNKQNIIFQTGRRGCRPLQKTDAQWAPLRCVFLFCLWFSDFIDSQRRAVSARLTCFLQIGLSVNNDIFRCDFEKGYGKIKAVAEKTFCARVGIEDSYIDHFWQINFKIPEIFGFS